MVNISEITKELSLIVAAIRGKWERRAVKEGNDKCTWVIVGQVVFVEGDLSKFPYGNDFVIEWHTQGTGHWGILR